MKYLFLIITFILLSCEPIYKYDDPPCKIEEYGNVEIKNVSSHDIYINIGIYTDRFEHIMLKDSIYLEQGKTYIFTEVPCGTLIYFMSYDNEQWYYKDFHNYLIHCSTSNWFWDDIRLRSSVPLKEEPLSSSELLSGQ